jgi:aspartate/methionine/tyrosine aminotransferase
MKIPPFKLERYFAKYEFTAKYLLSSSDCESLRIQDLLAMEEGAAEAFRQHWLGYTESQGAPSLRKEIARIYETIQPEQALVHSGAEEAIFLFMNAALQPGDHLVVHWPCYQSLYEVAKSLGCQVTLWEARRENGWALDLEELKQAVRPETKGVVVNNPHNPTGFLMSQQDFRELNAFTQERDLWLFSDEVYRESEHSPEYRLPAACDLNENAISLGVMSKTYGLAGLRIGWIATRNPEIYRKMAAMKDYTTICNSAPSEFLAELALRHRQMLVDRTVSAIRSNLVLLDDFFQRYADRFDWIRPHAGPIAFPRLLDGNAEDFCRDVVTQTGVMLVPGSQFGHSKEMSQLEAHFRIGFGRKNMPEALETLSQWIES